MIQINLLTEERKKKQERMKQFDLSGLNLDRIPIIKIIVGIFATVIIVQAALAAIGLYSMMTYGGLQKRYNEMLPKKREADAVKDEIRVVSSKVKAIDELMVNRFSWARKLSDLNEAMVAGIWLSSLKLEQTSEKPALRQPAAQAPKQEPAVTRMLVLSGYASNASGEGTAAVGKFIQSLKTNQGFFSDFKDIELGSIKRDRFEETEVMSFMVKCIFKEEKKR